MSCRRRLRPHLIDWPYLDASERGVAASHVRGPHVRLPDERARLRAHRRAARGSRLRRRPRATPPISIVFNTCAVRENADNRLYGNLGHLRPVKDAHPGHADRRRRLPGAEGPRVTSSRGRPGSTSSSARTTSASLPALLERARHNAEAQVEIAEALEVFPSVLPARRESAASGWVSISVGCDNTCTFCIVPSLRGGERDRRPGDVLAEVQALVEQGVLEITLLGQNVNSYGAQFGDPQRVRRAAARHGPHRRAGAGALHLAAPARLHRRRHRRHGRDAERLPVAAHAAAVRLRRRAAPDAPQLPGRAATSASSSGSGRRCPTRRSPPTSSSASPARPRPTSRRPSTSFARPASPAPSRSSTPSAPVRPPPNCPTRSTRPSWPTGTAGSSSCRTRSSWEANRALVGGEVEVLLAEGEGRKDAGTGRMSGRARDGRLVHLNAPDSDAAAAAGGLRVHRHHPRGTPPPARRRTAGRCASHRGR